MKISVPLYQSGYKVVSIALDEQTKDDLLSEESTAFIIVGFVATLGAAVGFLPRHNWLVMS